MPRATKAESRGDTPEPPEPGDAWEEAARRERLSLSAHHVTRELTSGSGAASSESTRPILEERIIHLEHASYASPSIVTTRRSDGAVVQRDRRTGRTRLLVSGEFPPVTGEDHESEELGPDCKKGKKPAKIIGSPEGEELERVGRKFFSGPATLPESWREKKPEEIVVSGSIEERPGQATMVFKQGANGIPIFRRSWISSDAPVRKTRVLENKAGDPRL